MPSQLVNDELKLEVVKTRDLDEFSRSSSSGVYQEGQKDRDVRVLDSEELESFESWAVHRGQNCLEGWRRCHIVNPGPVLSEVKFQDDAGNYFPMQRSTR